MGSHWSHDKQSRWLVIGWYNRYEGFATKWVHQRH